MARPHSPLKGFNNYETVPFTKREKASYAAKEAKSKALSRKNPHSAEKSHKKEEWLKHGNEQDSRFRERE